MAEQQGRCPTCGRRVDPSLLTYSNATDNFVCPDCRELSDAAHEPAPPGVAIPRRRPKKTLPAWSIAAAVLLVAAMCITTIAIVLSSRATPQATQLAWEDQNHDRLIALKSEAEALALDGKLAEAHAKYRELEKLVGGRKLKDASLFDILEAARGDQDRIYKMLLRQLGDTAPSPGILNRPIPADATSTPPTGDVTSTTQEGVAAAEPYPPSYDLLRVPSATQTTAKSTTTPAGNVEIPTPSTSPRTPDAPPAQADAPAATLPQVIDVIPPTETVAPTSASVAPTSAPVAGANPTTEPGAISIPGPDDSKMPTTQIGGREYAMPPRLDTVSDAAITDALMRGNEFLLSNFKDGVLQLNEPMSETENAGVAALCTYALMQSGRATDDPRLGIKSPQMIQLIEKLKAMDLGTRGGFDLPATYSRSIRAAALAIYNRPDDRDQLKDDVAWLINAAVDGAYSYDDRYSPTQPPVVPRRKTPATAPAKRVRGVSWNGVEAPVILVDGTFTPINPGAGAGPPPQMRGAGYPNVGGYNNPQGAGYTPRGGYGGSPGGTSTGGVVTGGYGRRVRIVVPDRPMFQNTLRNRPARALPSRRDQVLDNFPWDNSNSQYGVLGVWAGAEVGIEVPEKYWRAVEQHWTRYQLPSGEWPYAIGWQGSFPMTTAGIATLFITHDYLDAPLLGARGLAGVRPYNESLTSALAWLEDGDNAVNVMQKPALDGVGKGEALFYFGYNMFGIERVGLASGFKHFGKHDWFVELTAKVLPLQSGNGAFGRRGSLHDTLIDTSFIMLFLSRGRHPVMMNKLRFDGEWTNRPRDVANLTAYASRELERQLNWQVVDIRREPDDWADSPILYIASQKELSFKDEELGKLMQFVDDGGIIFTHADQGSDKFNKSVAALCKRMFPMYELTPLSTEHELYKLNYNIKMPRPRPRLQGVSNGVRLLLVHSPTDLSDAWQLRSTVSRKDSFQLGSNLYLYGTGKERFRNRLDTTMIPPPVGQPQRTVEMARLRYRGNWDPEPGAWGRIARKLEWETGVKLSLTAVDGDEITPEKFRIAHMTGTTSFNPNDQDLTAVKNFVNGGGTLLIDAAGGAAAFAEAETTWIPKILAGAKLEPLKADDPLLKKTIDGTVDVPNKSLRLYAMTKLGAEGIRIKSAKVGKGRVIFSPLDITSGLLGTNTWGVLGYLPEYCEAVVRNLLLTTPSKSQ